MEWVRSGALLSSPLPSVRIDLLFACSNLITICVIQFSTLMFEKVSNRQTFYAALQIYFWIVVYSFYQELKESGAGVTIGSFAV